MESGANNTDNDAIVLFLLIAVPAGMIWAVAHFFPFPFSWTWQWITRGEVHFLSLFAAWLPKSLQHNLVVISEGLARNRPGTVSWTSIFEVENALYPFNEIPYIVILSGMAAWIYRFAVIHHQRHTLETLIDVQTRGPWRFSRMFVKHNPLKTGGGDVTKGPFRISESPEAFAARTGTLIRTVGQDARFNDEAAQEALRAQLGPRFQGLQNLREQEQWLAAALLLRADGKKKDSDKWLGDISCFYADEYPKADLLRDARSRMRWYCDHEITQRLGRQHAYVSTFFMGLLAASRAQGKCTTSMFPWLILYDRTLFFALNNIGTVRDDQTSASGWTRPTGHVEGLGPSVHYVHERVRGRAIAFPTAADAAEALRQQLLLDNLLPKPRPEPGSARDGADPAPSRIVRSRGGRKPRASAHPGPSP